MENDVMGGFTGDLEYDWDDESDEAERYLHTKISFTKDNTLLES